MIEFHSGKCTRCGWCASVCPNQVIAPPEGNDLPYTAKPDDCIDCWHCVAVCPNLAIRHSHLTDQSVLEKNDLTISAQDMNKFLSSIRSVRQYKNKPIDDNQLDRLIRTAELAPSSSNAQNRHFAVISDAELISQLDDKIVNAYRRLYRILAVFAPFSAKLRKLRAYFAKLIRKAEQGIKPVFRNAPSVVAIYAEKSDRMAHVNCISAQEYLIIQAHASGLGTCVIGFAIHFHKIMEKALNLDKNMRVHSVLIMGYPKYPYAHTIRREPSNFIRR